VDGLTRILITFCDERSEPIDGYTIDLNPNAQQHWAIPIAAQFFTIKELTE
jgi:hypothetical protein